MQIIDDPMKRRQVDRLDNAHVVERDVKVVLGQGLQFAAGEAGAAERRQLVAIGPLDGAENVRTVAGTADGDEQIAGTSKVLQLLDEDALEPLVVAPCEDIRRIVGQAEDADALLFVVVEIFAPERAFADVFAEMRGIRSTPAVADDKDKSIALVTIVHQVGQAFNLGPIDAKQLLSDALQKRSNVQFGTKHSIDTPQ